MFDSFLTKPTALEQLVPSAENYCPVTLLTSMTAALKQPLWLDSQRASIKVLSQRYSQSVGHNHQWLEWEVSNWLTLVPPPASGWKPPSESLEIKTRWNIGFTHIMVTFTATAGTSWSWALSQTSSRSWHWQSSGTTPSTGETAGRERDWSECQQGCTFLGAHLPGWGAHADN